VNIGWQHLERVHLIWVVLLFVGCLFVLELRARGALASFLSPVMQRRLSAQASFARAMLRLGLLTGSLVMCVLALMQPQVRGETETVAVSEASADVLFVLDVSRSMLADDAAPNRLARAKAEIAQLVGKLEGDRVGLIAFAGRAVPVCPLTPDHAYFSTVLSTVDTHSAGKGGSRVGEAIKAGVRAFPQGPGAKLMVLITDGDDQDPYTQEAAKAARDAGVKIVVIGLGSEAGSQIVLTDPQTGAKTTLMYEGKPVISKLDGPALQKIAITTEGAYIPAGTNAVDLESIMDKHVRPMVREASQTATRVIPAERFAGFVFVALILLALALWVGALRMEVRQR